MLVDSKDIFATRPASKLSIAGNSLYKWYYNYYKCYYNWPGTPVEGRNIMEADSVRIFQFPNEFAQWEPVSTVFTLYQTKVSHISSVETLEFKTSHQIN